MIQRFEIDFEYCADDRGYKEEELLELFKNALGNEYDIKWHKIKEIEFK
jgi:hypothetical protein